MRLRSLVAVLVAHAGALVIPVRAFVVTMPPVAIDRLIHSAQRYVRAHPHEADGHYTLARLHYLAFSTGLTTVVGNAARSSDELPSVDEYPAPLVRQMPFSKEFLDSRRLARAVELADEELHLEPGDYRAQSAVRNYQAIVDRWNKELERQHWTPMTSLPVREMVRHASAAADELHAALEIKANDPHFLLMLASLTEDVATWCELRQLNPVPKPLRPLSYEAAKADYLAAFRAARALEPQPTYDSDASIVAREAGAGYLRLAHGKADPPPSDVDSAQTVTEVDSGVRQIDALKPKPEDEEVIRLVSPIIFSLRPDAHLADLLAPNVAVDFDLRGYGERQRWPWVQPTTGFLVWDPQGAGSITSGQQLFGGYTFQVFRRDGYEALAALDDDGDGVLRGAELRGIRAWFDRNGDGRSEPDEVVDLDSLGIVAIAVTAEMRDGASPMNPAGLELSDGSTLPTWDWMTAPMPLRPKTP